MSAKAAASGKLRIRQIRSGIGFDHTQKATLRALGLGRLGRVRELPDNPQVRGMVSKIIHLLEVEETSAGSKR